MTHKDKIKELVGRSLNSYHTNALQQIDRIEKKNKEQNHKISMLTNELDNDYLTKSEEGSVISLEHSKEGMVYIDSLEGNTLVNYCTDGSKELTLNGDIDLEGTFITTTEGVDNGLVDVYCEGNTLVNCIKDATIKDVELIATTNGGFVQSPFYALDKFLFKPNTVYTFVALLKENTIDNSVQLCCSHSRTAIKTTTTIKTPLSNTIIFTFTTKEDFTGVDLGLYHQLSGCTSGKLSFTQMIFEGDWTNKEIPPYFEGMKSVGQDDENGHKIEILSKNKNLCTVSSYSGVRHNKIESNIPCKKNTVYTLTFKDESDLNQSGNSGITLITHKTKTDKKDHGNIYTHAMNEGGKEYTFRKSGFTFNTSDCCYISLTSNNMSSVPNLIIKEIQIEEGSQTSYSPQMFNKKEILLDEPLVGNDTVKDRVVKIGGKYFIERFWRTVTLDGTQELIKGGWEVPIFTYYVPNTEGEPTNFPNTLICDRIKPQSFNLNDNTHYALYTGKDSVETKRYIRMQIPTSIVAKDDLEGFKTWLRNNPVTIAYRLNTPIYEPLEIEPTLNTYNDVTHISNNSIIPCNMKIKNSGYNAIIKPSTLYTIALDTNKSGTIGMNLGGTKGTTTNNVLTLTTPATLTDDSLRLYGKGIKGSKVRLLEGDKTNWIPSHFEGMKSSFEDKLQDDGAYKMEISSINKNIIHLQDCTVENNQSKTLIDNPSQYKDLVKLFNGKKVIISAYVKGENIQPIENMSPHHGLDILLQGGGTKVSSSTIWISLTKGILPHTGSFEGRYKKEFVFGDETVITGFKGANIFLRNMTGKLTMTNIMLEIVNETEYIPHKHNKIQFSSIEPLRGVDDVKDRFVFKDGKIMIERNCGTGSLDGTASIYHCWTNNRNDIVSGYIYYNEHKPEITNIKQYSNVVCTDLPNNRGGHISTEEGFRNTAYFAFSIHKSKLGIEDINAGEVNQNIVKRYFTEHPLNFVYQLEEPIYEEIPYELQKIILEGYENGTLFFDTNIPPTSTVTYAGETPIVKSVKLNKTEVLNNTNDINDNIIPYLMDMDYRVVCLQLESNVEGISMAKLFGGAYEMLKRDILSKRLTKEEYGYRLADYFNAGKLTEQEVRELEDLR